MDVNRTHKASGYKH